MRNKWTQTIGLLLILFGLVLGGSFFWIMSIWNEYGVLPPHEMNKIIIEQAPKVAPFGFLIDILVMFIAYRLIRNNVKDKEDHKYFLEDEEDERL